MATTFRARRLGRFEIDVRFIDEFNTAVKRIMGKCIIVRAEMRYDTGRVEYVAISDHFDEVELGQTIPSYDWIIHADGDIQCELK